MVVTRQAKVLAAAAAAGSPDAQPAAPLAPRARSPRKRGAANQRGHSTRRKGPPSPLKAEETRRGRSPSVASPSRPRRGRTPRVQLASKAEVIPSASRAASKRGASKSRPLLKGGALSCRMQTGPLPFVRQMSGMSLLEASQVGGPPPAEQLNADPETIEDASLAARAPQPRHRHAAAAAAAAEEAAAAGGPLKPSCSTISRVGGPEKVCSSEKASLYGRCSTLSSCGSRLSEGKLGQLLLTYFCYASLYLTRKPFASSKRELEIQLGLSAATLGGVDSAFLGAYAASQLLLAPALLGGPRGPSCEAILAVAYGVSAGSCLLIYLLPDALLSPLSLSCLWGLNGAAQALAFPLIVSLLSTWLSNSERGGVLGVWSTCQQVGSILASYLTAELLTGATLKQLGPLVLETTPSWRLAFLVPSVWVFGCALLLGKGLRRAPDGGPSAAAAAEEEPAAAPQQQQQQQQQERSMLGRALSMGSVRGLCAAYFCIKLVRYSLLYWLPYYFEKHVALTSTAAGIVNGCGSVGSIVQGLVTPVILSRYGWDEVFYALASTAAFGGLSLIPGAIKDIRVLSKRKTA